ncbi:uncharacterized protein LOC117786825 [Drosophila innubila]|uniref:uncharacterized protein LOC117786825 n=1 Tax=Drosophila innubila TaxID=198719 RepID=UPI00148CF384|nr:uncharacterized protein LOC117786825 [Drosophila innubila]
MVIPLLQCLEPRYVVNTDYCRIPDPDPYSADVLKEFRRGKYEPCTKLQPLTWVEYNESSQRYVLSINESAYQWYLKLDLELSVPAPATLKCCYMDVQRVNEQEVELGSCRDFQRSVQLPNDTDSFIVECYARGKLIYTNGHATVPERSELRQRLNRWKQTDERAPSVLMIGIDTVSRLNLKRAMPKTYTYLRAKDWFELSGYNKIGDNTLPNLLALLTGLNLSSITEQCDPHKVAALDRCEFLWQLYRNLGYVTAFGEDDVPINTFNYQLKGFHKSPVDYYMRPYLMAAEQWLDMSEQQDQEQQICLGYEHASEHVYNYALEFTRRYRNDSFFGFFWTNTHSHGSHISRTSAMDNYMTSYLERLVQQDTMEHTIVVLLSDHGMRLGSTRLGSLGWLEERLPFLFIWLPEYLRQSHPEFVQALQLNGHRLSNPYDLHATLKHILVLSGRHNSTSLDGAKDCPNCQSLLLPLSLNRSCADVAIADHWCTCWSYREYTSNSSSSSVDQQMAQLAFNYISNLIAESRLIRNLYGFKPASLAGISKSLVAVPNKADDPRVSIHRLQITTQPRNIVYEVTIRYNSSSKDIFVSDVSRLGSIYK